MPTASEYLKKMEVNYSHFEIPIHLLNREIPQETKEGLHEVGKIILNGKMGKKAFSLIAESESPFYTGSIIKKLVKAGVLAISQADTIKEVENYTKLSRQQQELVLAVIEQLKDPNLIKANFGNLIKASSRPKIIDYFNKLILAIFQLENEKTLNEQSLAEAISKPDPKAEQYQQAQAAAEAAVKSAEELSAASQAQKATAAADLKKQADEQVRELFYKNKIEDQTVLTKVLSSSDPKKIADKLIAYKEDHPVEYEAGIKLANPLGLERCFEKMDDYIENAANQKLGKEEVNLHYQHAVYNSTDKSRDHGKHTVSGSEHENLKNQFKNLKGDYLKTRILFHFKEELGKARDSTELEKKVKELKNSEEYQVLEKGQGWATKFFQMDTSSKKAFESMITEFKAKVPSAAAEEEQSKTADDQSSAHM